MKKDIEMPKVAGVKICIAKSTNNLGESDWGVYLINNNLIELENVMIVSKGYEGKDKNARQTSTLRHMIEKVEAQSVAKIESISPEVFSFYNEFWVSYYIIKELFDKKFVIEPFQEFNLQEIAELDLQGKIAQ
ncbi:hypothetical protein [Roseivirga pacifica]|uniref:hypothetical protein n=1 Tax=Roseivirga pacifica TaxID=1267423 RepID=UPI002094259A|nr:hypothetical protein [Roseivirga pacifica]MCO6359865.1 hypothetical protein [Roseivirga pacifica]MCO6367235.1 hypothetical protein [Roseivirga pacifica]MCO6370233.1 hypothetical protein [Roseivirga pacifica]MCO6374892.1 hypothetical protein [Roseivirga pacifica]MCO6380150.1 hypothetical protein [Roseivirga pacifica]